MTSQLPPPVAALPFVAIDATGRPIKPHPTFLKWLNEALFVRAGGGIALTNSELEDQILLVESDAQLTPPVIPPDPQPDPSGRLEQLEARLYQLAEEIQALRQGTIS